MQQSISSQDHWAGSGPAGHPRSFLPGSGMLSLAAMNKIHELLYVGTSSSPFPSWLIFLSVSSMSANDLSYRVAIQWSVGDKDCDCKDCLNRQPSNELRSCARGE